MKIKFLLLLLLSSRSVFAQDAGPATPPSARIESREALEELLQKELAKVPLIPDAIYPFLPENLKRTIETNQPQAGDYLVSLATNPQSQWHRQAVGAFVQCWKSMSAEQVTKYLQGAIVLTVGARPRYHLSSNAYIRYSYTVRHESYFSIEIKTRTTHFVDGIQWQEPYEFQGPWATTGWARTGDLKLGEHYASMKTAFEWSYNGLKGKGEIESPRFPFSIVSDDTPDDLKAIDSEESRQLIKTAFSVSDWQPAPPLVFNGPVRPGAQNTIEEIELPPGEGPIWKLNRALPFALCFDVEIHDTANGEVFQGGRFLVLAGQTYSSQFVPDDWEKFAATRTGLVPVKVVLQPSYELALSEPKISAYFDAPLTFEGSHIHLYKPKKTPPVRP